MAYANLNGYCLLEKVKGNSMLDDDKTILSIGINTLWSAVLLVAK